MADEQTDRLERILKEMPKIAEAVNAFPEAVQLQAFEQLMAELRGEPAPTTKTVTTSERGQTKRRTSKLRAKANGDDAAATRRRRGGSPSTVRDLDLTPKGEQSFTDFVAEKQPKTNHDRNAVAVYYLAEVLRLPAVTLDHVFTCYKDMRWREPGNLANSLALTSSRKRFLDTSNLDGITLTPPGRNHVEHDLPPKSKG